MALGLRHYHVRDLAADCQRRSQDIVREQYAIAVLRIERRNSALTNAPSKVPVHYDGGRACVYYTAATNRQGARKNTNGGVLKVQLVLSWTGRYKILSVGLCPADAFPDHWLLRDKRCCIWTFRRIFPAPTPSAASLSLAATHASICMTLPTRRGTSRRT